MTRKSTKTLEKAAIESTVLKAQHELAQLRNRKMANNYGGR